MRFQRKWFEDFPWIHFSREINKIVCFYCEKAESENKLELYRKKDSSFLTDGFSNWKKGNEKFRNHEMSDCHRHVIALYRHATKSAPIERCYLIN